MPPIAILSICGFEQVLKPTWSFSLVYPLLHLCDSGCITNSLVLLQRPLPMIQGQVSIAQEVFEQAKRHGTCAPETFYTGRLVRHRGKEWVMTGQVLTVTTPAVPAADSGADVQTYGGTPATQAAPTPKRSRPLPDGIPEMIEVDVGGRIARGAQAQVVGVVSGKLVCLLVGGQRIKTSASGRDISWRVPCV